MPRRLANGTHAPPPPINLPLERDASSQAHAVLDRVSPAYPPVAGGLHTRYAPVRRSPARHRCRLLPLDLHVLSLPLAFILSQDQTLHGNYLLLSKVCLSPGFPLARSPGHRPRGPSGLLACFLLLLLSQCVNELSVPRPPQGSRPGFRLAPSRPPGRPGRPLFPFGGCKSTSFFRTAKLFRKNFSKSFFPAAPAPSASLPPLPRSRETGPQKYCFFTIRQTFFKKIFEKFLNPLTVSIKKNARILIDSPPERGSGLQNAPPISTSPGLAPWEMTRIFPENRRESHAKNRCPMTPHRPPTQKNRGANSPEPTS